MAEPQLPTKHPSGFEIQHHRQIVVLPVYPQVGKVLYPSTTIHHVSVVHASLRVCVVAEDGVVFEGILRSLYLRPSASFAVLLAAAGNGDARQRADASGFILAPVQFVR